jgi:hypothetical protein
MTLSAGGIGATAITISSMTQSATNQTITMSAGTDVSTQNGSLFVASGGQYRFQFGTQAAQRLDSYYKLLNISTHWDETSSSATSSATQVGLIPAAPSSFIVQNNTRVRTVPQTLATSSTDCSLVLQYGAGNATAFLVKNPNPGDVLRVSFVFGASSAL